MMATHHGSIHGRIPRFGNLLYCKFYYKSTSSSFTQCDDNSVTSCFYSTNSTITFLMNVHICRKKYKNLGKTNANMSLKCYYSKIKVLVTIETGICVWYYESPKRFLLIIFGIILALSIFISYCVRRAKGMKLDPVPCECLLWSTHIRCASCGVWAQTTHRLIKTQWSFGAEHLNNNPQSLLSHCAGPQLLSQWSTALVNILLRCLWNEGSPESAGLTDTFKSEQLISIKCAPSVSV